MATGRKKNFDREQAIHAIRLDTMTDEEKAARNAAGGRAAAEARRRKKAMREVAKAMLETELQANDELRKDLEDRGFRDYTEAAAVLLAQLFRQRIELEVHRLTGSIQQTDLFHVQFFSKDIRVFGDERTVIRLPDKESGFCQRLADLAVSLVAGCVTE